MRTVFTDQGLNKIITASILGPKMEITGVKVSSDLYDPSQTNIGAFTNLSNIVWSGDNMNIRYQAKTDTGSNSKVITYIVTMDEAVPEIDFGTLGLYAGDTLVTVTCFDRTEHRSLGDRNVYDIMFGINGSSEAMAIDVILPAECSIPYITTTASLPTIIESPFNAYACGIHEEFGVPCIAVRGVSEWMFYFPNDASGGLDSSAFASNVPVGGVVYYNPTTGLLELANPTTGFIGLRGERNTLVTDGIYVNPSLNLTPGADYYVGENGTLTLTPNNYYVGKAINESTLFLGIGSEASSNKINKIDVVRNSSIKYPSEMAIVNMLSQTLTITGHWDLKNAKVYWQ